MQVNRGFLLLRSSDFAKLFMYRIIFALTPHQRTLRISRQIKRFVWVFCTASNSGTVGFYLLPQHAIACAHAQVTPFANILGTQRGTWSFVAYRQLFSSHCPDT
ncbi:hypothetical protein KCP78_20190 [Salmonella enterica subsp. enterica]|nr:hypothetical protein KCP78_20190 [Salmonella enterica subsp. enterica]